MLAEYYKRIDTSIFQSDAHRTVWRIVSEMRVGGTPVEVVTLTTRLREEKLLDSIGGATFLNRLLEAGSVTANLDFYLQKLKGIAASRESILAMQDAIAHLQGYDWTPEETGKKLGELAERLNSYEASGRSDPPMLIFRSPREWSELILPEGFNLVGDNYLTRGDIAFLAGVPGCGKSRAAVALAVAGATGKDWLGLPVHKQFKTLIIQNENGPVRLRDEFTDIPDSLCDDGSILVTEPPQCGLCFQDARFRDEIRKKIEEQGTGLLIVDPYNAATANDRLEDYKGALDAILSCLPADPLVRPAILILHHLRKQQNGSTRKRGGELLAELSGSYVIGSKARTVFILEQADPRDAEDDTVIFTTAKANNGRKGPPSAWHRGNGLFLPCADFDWESWNNPSEGSTPSRRKVTTDTLRSVFRGDQINREEYRSRMEVEQGFKRTTAYDALKRFSDSITESKGLLWIKEAV